MEKTDIGIVDLPKNIGKMYDRGARSTVERRRIERPVSCFPVRLPAAGLYWRRIYNKHRNMGLFFFTRRQSDGGREDAASVYRQQTIYLMSSWKGLYRPPIVAQRGHFLRAPCSDMRTSTQLEHSPQMHSVHAYEFLSKEIPWQAAQ